MLDSRSGQTQEVAQFHKAEKLILKYHPNGEAWIAERRKDHEEACIRDPRPNDKYYERIWPLEPQTGSRKKEGRGLSM